MADDNGAANTGVLDKLGGTITKVSAIIGTVVAINTAATTYSTDRVARYAAYRDAVKVEEAYWKGLYDDYLTTFDEKYATDIEQRKAKRFAISNLANHDVPGFEEFSVDNDIKLQARNRLLAMRKSLIDALQDKSASGTAVAEASKEATFAADEATPMRDRTAAGASTSSTGDAAPVVVPPIDAAAAGASLSYQTQLLAAGKPTGWDIDVFWCQGSEEVVNAAKARAAATILAQKAAQKLDLAPGISLGRVRLRSLPEAFQRTPSYPWRGSVIVRDADPAEVGVANQILTLVGSGAAPPFVIKAVGGRTRWYLSLFVCPLRPVAAEATPAAAAAIVATPPDSRAARL